MVYLSPVVVEFLGDADPLLRKIEEVKAAIASIDGKEIKLKVDSSGIRSLASDARGAATEIDRAGKAVDRLSLSFKTGFKDASGSGRFGIFNKIQGGLKDVASEAQIAYRDASNMF